MMRTLQIFHEIFHFDNNFQEIAIIALNVYLFKIAILGSLDQSFKAIKEMIHW